MIQRIQSLYLVLAAGCALGLNFVLKLWTEIQNVFAFDLLSSPNTLLMMIPILFIVSGGLSLLSIFLFKNRQNQFVMNRINILINFILLGLLIYYLLTLPGDTKISEKGIGVTIPIITVVLLVLANKATQKDEHLVKSVDRLR